MPTLRIDLTLTSLTPLSVGAGGSSGTRADKSILRDGRGRPIIPGSQLKGKLRHACEALLRSFGRPVPRHFDDDGPDGNLIRAIFGSPSHASPLRFRDLAASGVDQPAASGHRLSRIRPSVAISRHRRTAEDERLLLQEAALEGMRFSAAPAIAGNVRDPAAAGLLWAALRLTTRWGGATSRGLGWSSVEATVLLDGEALDEPALAALLRAAAQGGG